MENSAQLDSADVTVVRAAEAVYGALKVPGPAPELAEGCARTVAAGAVRDLFVSWGLDSGRLGSTAWNPLGELIRPGARVLIKPNWVLHCNRSGQSFDCMVTHASVIDAVLEYVALCRPGQVTIGDAPVQGCDFEALRTICGLDAMAEQWRVRGMEVEIRDFRRTILHGPHAMGEREEGRRDLSHYVLFDLGTESLLEAIGANADFRVTMYNPDLLMRTHGPGRHQYLIAREAIEADIIINLPKLKSHKKACVTGALKNLIGINGNKEFLPHHRKGGSAHGGDCYEGGSWIKRSAEDLLDAANRRSGRVRAAFVRCAGAMLAGLRRMGGNDDVEGSWYGNDTIWRTCLDLDRIALYGRPDGTLAETPQREVVTITDAIIGGDGEGPLSPGPVPSGFLTGARNLAAAEWVHALLMGFDPNRIPVVREAFRMDAYPLATFQPETIRARFEGRERPASSLGPLGPGFRPAAGWEGHCEASRREEAHGID